MNAQPLVSILIPCYNHAAFLDDNLTSLLAQDYENIELLICDDCSPDDSFLVIQSYASRLRERFSRVEILKNDVNCGVTVNINRMLRLAKGEFIKIIASDDAMTTDAISAMVSHLQAQPQVGVVIANGLKVSEEQHYPDFVSQEPVYTAAPQLSGAGLFERIAAHNEIFAPGAMFRAWVFERYGLYDETIAVEDLEYWLRVLRDEDFRFGYIHKPLLYYRINGGSMTSTVTNANLEKRRVRFHGAIMQTFEKYRADFSRGTYARLAMTRILDEMSFAIDRKMDNWEHTLQQELKQFPARRELPLKNRPAFCWRYVKMKLRKIIKLRGTGHR